VNGEPGSWAGGGVGDHALCVLAPNPGPMTLEGTNTWVLGAPGATRVVVVDPGPHDERHLHAVLDAVRARGAEVALALVTHGHEDHVAGARRFAELAGCPVRAADAALCVDDDPLVDGETIDVDGLEVEVLATPGHTADSMSFWLLAEGAILTGDTVLGRGTAVVAYPDGALAPYLDSLRRLRALVEAARGMTLLPGHGPPRSDAVDVLDFYLEHRARRLDQVREALAAGARTPAEIVERVYADVDRRLWPAAERTVRAQLDYLSAVASES